jgi:predicted protein tyrosine phosphatase
MPKVSMNRIHNLSNPHQGEYKKVLCICSAGLLRSPTAAVVLSQDPYNFNTRAAGLVEDYALVYADEALLMWADEIVCMDYNQFNTLEHMKLIGKANFTAEVINLNISDNYVYRDPELIELIKSKYDAHKHKLDEDINNGWEEEVRES